MGSQVNEYIRFFWKICTERVLIGDSGNSTLHLNRAKSLAFDSEGNLYVADVGNQRVQKFAIDNSACLLPERKSTTNPIHVVLCIANLSLNDVAETPEDRWSSIRRRLYPSKVQRENTAKLGLGYNPFKDSPVCYTEI